MGQRLVLLGATVVAVLSCGPVEGEGQVGGVTGFADPSVVVSTNSDQIGMLSDLAMLSDGVVVAADLIASVVLRIDVDGSVTRLGRSGQGPGEFEAPSAVDVLRGDTIAVWDPRAGRVQLFDRSGEYARAYPAAAPEGVRPAVDDRGWLAAPTLGMADGLVRVVDPAGSEVAVVGELLAPGSTIVDFGAALNDIRRGVIPAFTRNAARVAWASPEAVWILPESEAVVMRVSMDGEVLSEAPIEDSVLEAIREGYFESASGPASQGAVRPFRYYADVERVGEEVWLMVVHPDTGENFVLVVGADGRVSRRMPLPHRGRLGTFTVDLDRGVLFASEVDAAQLLRFPLVYR